MNIQSRQNHLSEMGVPQWHARFVLVGAAKSPKINLHSLKAQASLIKAQGLPVVGELRQVENTPLVGYVAAKDVESLVGEVTQALIKSPPSGVSALSEVPVLAPKNIGATELKSIVSISGRQIPNVLLGAFVDNDYVVVSEMGSNESHLEEISLLQNIIRVVDSTCSKFEFAGGFSWPVFQSAKVLVGQELLHEGLIARWLLSFDLTQCRVLICFGEQSKTYVEALLNGSSQQLGGCKAVFFDNSLTNLYKAPLRKKDVWKVLSENLDIFNRSSGS